MLFICRIAQYMFWLKFILASKYIAFCNAYTFYNYLHVINVLLYNYKTNKNTVTEIKIFSEKGYNSLPL